MSLIFFYIIRIIWVQVYHGEEMAEEMKAEGRKVRPREMICWESLGPGIHVDVSYMELLWWHVVDKQQIRRVLIMFWLVCFLPLNVDARFHLIALNFSSCNCEPLIEVILPMPP